MKSRLSIAIVLVVLCALLSTGSGGEARAQQGQERGPGVDRLFNLTSYQGLEEMPYFGEAPAVDAQSPAAPDVNVPYSQIVFQSFRNETDWNIFLADGSGGSQTQLTSDAAADIHPRLNRGCTRIVFASKRTGNYEIYTMNLDGSGLVQLTQNDFDDVYPAWSYDGSLIVFQSYRDSNPEIYTMNADGSNQTRLTWEVGYDGTPSWSPDGRIVFASDRIGTGGIWVMNADGWGAAQLASEPYSIYPAWSPDGSQIAYSAESDGDGFSDLWVMNADGTNRRQLIDTSFQKEAWARSWSPDGHYIAYTHIAFIFYQGNWYWTTAYLYAWDTMISDINAIAYNPYEWHPDWQISDVLPPVSSITVLPAESPSHIFVSWSGYDNGPSGVKNFDVQIKDGIGGSWTDWWMATQQTNSYYSGVGGHTYYFRVRARDHVDNVESWPVDYDTFTRVEAFAPITRILPVPLYTRGENIHFSWDGYDPGGSGILSYDIQIRDVTSGNTWEDWLMGTTSTSADFVGTPGHTYQYRLRATDYAQNLENWQSGNGDAQTTFYTWAVTGILHDNRDMPLPEADISVDPAAFLTFPGDNRGQYAAYVASASDTYSVSWGKSGYQELPFTSFTGQQDVQQDVVLPPDDNIIKNWGFEKGNLQDWSTGGAITPTVVNFPYHTGEHSGVLGYQPPPALPNKIFGDIASLYDMQIAVDQIGVVHVVFSNSNVLYYVQRDNIGNWSSPINISGTLDYSEIPKLAVDADGNVHVVWRNSDFISYFKIYYTQRNSSGSWSTPQVISPDWAQKGGPELAIDAAGIVYVAWWSYGSTPGIVFTREDEYGNWLTPQSIPGAEAMFVNPVLVVDGVGNLHVVWAFNKIYYTSRSSSGGWSGLEIISPGLSYSDYPQLIIDDLGMVHVIWAGSNGSGWQVHYTRRELNGTWSQPLNVSPSIIINAPPHLVLDGNGTLHVAFEDGWKVYYAHCEQNGSWTEAKEVSDAAGATSSQIGVSEIGIVHIVWTDWGDYGKDVIYYYGNGDSWLGSDKLTPNPTTALDPKLAIGAEGTAHIVWVEYEDPDIHAYYVQKTVSAESGFSTLSQTIRIPVTMTAPTLSFLYQLEGASSNTGSYFSVFIRDSLTTTAVLSTSANTSDWTHAWFDLTPWISQTITLTFNVHEVKGYPSAYAYLDEITVGSAHPDAWVSALGLRAAMPGETVTFRLSYGNRSLAVEALSATITATLPAGLIFESASLTPTVNADVLTWSVGSLPAGSEPFTILVTATVAGDAVLGSTLTLPIEIATITPELELVNNQDEYEIYIGSMVYLPLLQR